MVARFQTSELGHQHYLLGPITSPANKVRCTEGTGLQIIITLQNYKACRRTAPERLEIAYTYMLKCLRPVSLSYHYNTRGRTRFKLVYWYVWMLVPQTMMETMDG